MAQLHQVEKLCRPQSRPKKTASEAAEAAWRMSSGGIYPRTLILRIRASAQHAQVQRSHLAAAPGLQEQGLDQPIP